MVKMNSDGSMHKHELTPQNLVTTTKLKEEYGATNFGGGIRCGSWSAQLRQGCSFGVYS